METEKTNQIIIPPLRNTSSLQIAPEAKEFSEIARRQLESLSKTCKKPRSKANSETSSPSTPPVVVSEPLRSEQKHKMTEITVISPPLKSSLTSSIVSRAELETEIRNKVSKDVTGTEIPHEILMADLETSACELGNDQEPQLHDQELIDILEGKHDEIELITETGEKIIVQSSDETADMSNFQIIEATTVEEDEAKRIERELAIQQIVSIAPRKNKRSYFEPVTPGAIRKREIEQQKKSLADSLAADWTDDEVVFEVVNVAEPESKEAKVKILNMKVIQEGHEMKKNIVKTVTMPTVSTSVVSGSPKILNICATNEPAATFKRARVVKKIFDPSSQSKPKEIPLVNLPPSITIKKVTKETIAEQQEKSAARGKRGKRSEIDKLLGDEGAVNMIYSLEREKNNQDVPEIEVKPNDESLIDKSEEKSSLITRANAIKNAVMKKSVSPPETTKATGRARKRDATPVKTPEEKKPVRQVAKLAAASTTNAKKKKPDETWDYVYQSRPAQTTCDDAMIIRRRSNSSYSSSIASPRRLSLDVESPRKDNKESSSFEFTKPPEKSDSKAPADFFKKDFVEELRGKISDVIKGEKGLQAPAKGKKRAAAAESAASTTKRASRANGADNKLLKVDKTGQIVKLTLAQSSLTIPLMNELRNVLTQLEKDDSKIVILKSADDGITGLNYKSLIQTTADKRKQAASELLTAVK